jgi:cytochrome c oxidase assembly factor CtaG/cytochrome c2
MGLSAILLGVLLLGIPSPAAAHDAAAPASLAPGTVALVLGALYMAALVRRHRGHRSAPSPAWAGALGTLAMVAAMLPPLDHAAAVLLSAHMSQHLLLGLVAAPLLARSAPVAVLAEVLPRSSRVRRLLHVPIPTFAAWCLHAAALWAWHLPPLYALALQRPAVHGLDHALLLGTGVLFWWTAMRGRRWPATALYVFLLGVQMSALGALLVTAPRPWFAAHGAGGAGLSGLEDQQLGGLIMWVPAGVLTTGIALALVARWLRTAERRSESPAGTAGRTAWLLVIAVVALATMACDASVPTAIEVAGGDPRHGRDLLRAYGCHTCHTIPGVPGAVAKVGPSLAGLATRGYVAGQPNAPGHLMEWIRHPQQVRPATPMPDTHVNEADARDIATYLYTLR